MLNLLFGGQKKQQVTRWVSGDLQSSTKEPEHQCPSSHRSLKTFSKLDRNCSEFCVSNKHSIADDRKIFISNFSKFIVLFYLNAFYYFDFKCLS